MYQKNQPTIFGTIVPAMILWVIYWLLVGKSLLYTSDSGAYLLNAKELKVPGDRSIYYSVILSGFSLIQCFSQFPSLLCYSLCVALISFWYLNLFVQTIIPTKHYLFNTLISVFICLLTPLPWLWIQIMPDAFTALLFLSSWMLMTQAKSPKQWIHFGILIISLSTHSSHLPLFTLFIVGIYFLTWLLRKFQKTATKISIKMNVLALVIGWGLIIGSNIVAGNGPTLGKHSHVFFMGKLCENGILKDYLDETCSKKPNPLCSYKNQIPEHAWDFVWDPNGIFQNTGGWDHSDSLYKQVFHDIFSSPKLLRKFVWASVKASSQQFILTGAGDGMGKMDTSSTLVHELKSNYPSDYHRLLNSNQQTESINFTAFNLFYTYTYWILGVLTLILLLLKPQNYSWYIVFIVLLFCLSNSMVTGALANVINRLNARAIWLVIPLCFYTINEAFKINQKFKRIIP